MAKDNKVIYLTLICKAKQHDFCSHDDCECACHSRKALLGDTYIRSDKRGAVSNAAYQLSRSYDLPVGEKRTVLFVAVLKETGHSFTADEVAAFSVAFKTVSPRYWSTNKFMEAYDNEIASGSMNNPLF